MSRRVKPWQERFWAKVDKSSGVDGCWIWLGNRLPRGYGIFVVTGRSQYAHRLSYNLASPENPVSGFHMCVCHHCDTPSCVNPRHLFVGTRKQNSEDMVRKGRSLKGDSHFLRNHPDRVPRGLLRAGAKLDDDAVRSIRTDVRSLSQIAAQYGICFQLVSRIKKRRAWRHVI